MSAHAGRRAWVLGQFDRPEPLLEAARRLRVEGFTELDAHSPYPLPGAEEALFVGRSKVPLLAFLGGAAGVLAAYALQFWTAAIDYPIEVANRAPHAPPAFVPVTFELMVLFSALAIFVGLFFLWRFPRPHHPAFELEEFRSASTHAFWMSVATEPERAETVRARLEQQGAARVAVLEEELS